MRACLLVIECKIIAIREASAVKPGLVAAVKYRETTADVYLLLSFIFVFVGFVFFPPFCVKETVIQFTFTETAQM